MPMGSLPMTEPVDPSGLIRKAASATPTPVSVASVGHVCAQMLLVAKIADSPTKGAIHPTLLLLLNICSPLLCFRFVHLAYVSRPSIGWRMYLDLSVSRSFRDEKCLFAVAKDTLIQTFRMGESEKELKSFNVLPKAKGFHRQQGGMAGTRERCFAKTVKNVYP